MEYRMEHDESFSQNGSGRDVYRIIHRSADEDRWRQGCSARSQYVATVYGRHAAEHVLSLLNNFPIPEEQP